jgi:4-hydroxybenzoate polyprenyltransferase
MSHASGDIETYLDEPQSTRASGWTVALVAVSSVFVIFGLIGVPSLVLGIIALIKARTDPDLSKRLTWIGWLVLGLLFLVLVVFVVVVMLLAVTGGSSGPESVVTLSPSP